MGIKLLVCGGDITPHNNAKNFLHIFFHNWLQQLAQDRIALLGMLGNDDPGYLVSSLDDFERGRLFTRIDGKMVLYQGWNFWGYNFVPELPFAMKDWAKLDYPGAPIIRSVTRPGIFTEKGFAPIDNIDKFFAERGTIETDLEKVEFADSQHTIAVLHSPPFGIGLDVCYDGRKVGSKSVLRFLERTQPLLSLHGHIHESPEVSGWWKTNLGNTLAIQPGSRPVRIQISQSQIEAEILY
jgi:Icc-related predicted phosphoesterase